MVILKEYGKRPHEVRLGSHFRERVPSSEREARGRRTNLDEGSLRRVYWGNVPNGTEDRNPGHVYYLRNENIRNDSRYGHRYNLIRNLRVFSRYERTNDVSYPLFLLGFE